MHKKIVTLFIQDTEISLLALRGREIRTWARLNFEPGLVNQGAVLDQGALSVRVKELFERAKVQPRKTIVGLSGVNTLYRLVSLPQLPENLVDDAVRNAAQRILPISLDEIYLSYQVLPSSEGETKVLLAAIPRKVIDTVLPTLRDIGVDPYVMELAPLALCRILDRPTAIIIDTGASYLSILVVIDSVPQIVRTQQMSTEVESSVARMTTITDELERTITFYNSEHPEKPLDSAVPVFVCGSLAQFPENWKSLENIIGAPVKKLSSPLQFREGFVPDNYIVNIGLALKKWAPEGGEIGPCPMDLNVIPEVYLPQRPRVHRIVVPIAVTLAILLIILLTLRLYNTIDRNNSLASQLGAFESRISEQQMEPSRLKEAIDTLATRMEAIQGKTNLLNSLSGELERGHSRVDGDMVTITSTSVMQNVELRSIQHRGDSVQLNGLAGNRDQIFGYARALRESGRFAVVTISSINLAQSDASELDSVQLAMDALMEEAKIRRVDSQDNWTNDLVGLPTWHGEAIMIMVDDDSDPETIGVEKEIVLKDYLSTAKTKYYYKWDGRGQVIQNEENVMALNFAMTLRTR